MTKAAVATRKDIDDVIEAIQSLATNVDGRFDRLDTKVNKNSEDIKRILNHLDSIEKRLEISEQERIVIGHQLDRLDQWVNELAHKIGYKLGSS